MLRAIGRIPVLIGGPLFCWVLGHHWHTFTCITTMRVCDRCGFVVDDPLAK